jgi:carbonic anhydrase
LTRYREEAFISDMNQTVVDLLTGNEAHADTYADRFDELQHAQHPNTVSVCCSDSRVLQDAMWRNDDPGQVFTVGNIGNRVVQPTAEGDAVSGDVLYPIAHTDTDTAIVVGHTGCGAVTATYDALTGEIDEPPGIQHCLDILKPRLESGVEALPDDIARDEAINRLVEYNVDRQVEFLLESDDVPADTTVVGAVYDFMDVYSDRRGEVHVINLDGETDVDALRDAHSEIDDRIRRLWAY